MKKQLIKYSLLGLIVFTFVIPQASILALSPVPAPTISSVNPSFGSIGTTVTITGSYFSPTEGLVHVLLNNPQNNSYYKITSIIAEGTAISSVESRLVFTIPETVTWPFCVPGTPCPEAVPTQVSTPVGTFKLFVLPANNSLSNGVEFKITERGGQAQQTGTIKIAVISKTQAQNLVAKVEVRDTNTGNVAASGDTSSGSAIFNLPLGSYYATAIKDGYYQLEKVFFRIAAGVNDSIIIAMAPTDLRPTPVPPQPAPLCPFTDYFPVLQRGVRSDEVKKLQEILGLPADSQTGYFGTITDREVRERQVELGLPETGVIDPNIRPYFFPCYQIVVTYPNGGETFRAGETLTVKWLIERPYILRPSLPLPLGAARVQELSRDVEPTTVTPLPTTVAPIPTIFSIDLTQYGRVVYHLADVPLGGEGSYSWNIPTTIGSGLYRVRLSVGDTPVLFERDYLEKRVYLPHWKGWLWDESDNDFKIVNEGITPPPPPNPRLREQLEQLLRLVEQMQILLRSVISSL